MHSTVPLVICGGSGRSGTRRSPPPCDRVGAQRSREGEGRGRPCRGRGRPPTPWWGARRVRMWVVFLARKGGGVAACRDLSGARRVGGVGGFIVLVLAGGEFPLVSGDHPEPVPPRHCVHGDRVQGA